jgi:hypothetical protein
VSAVGLVNEKGHPLKSIDYQALTITSSRRRGPIRGWKGVIEGDLVPLKPQKPVKRPGEMGHLRSSEDARDTIDQELALQAV